MNQIQGLLPSVPHPYRGEALDGYLERLASSNGYDRANFAKLLGVSPENPLGAIPIDVPGTVRFQISVLTGLSEAQISAMTIRGMGEAAPYDLANVDPSKPRTLQSARVKGWFPPKGSPFCPECLDESGVWLLRWRIPFCTVCPVHGSYLISECPSCGKMPRTVRSSLFKGWMDDPAVCGNPTGSKTPCRQDLRVINAPVASDESAATGKLIWSALSGRPMTSVGVEVGPKLYFSDLKELSIVLLGLVSATPSSSLSQGLFAGEGSEYLENRRWSVAPPRDFIVRTRVLSEAGSILRKRDPGEAATAVEPWLGLLPKTNDSRLRWLKDRAPLSETIEGILAIADREKWRLSRLLPSPEADRLLPLRAVPQQLPVDVYSTYLAPHLSTNADTGRYFGSLCLARRHTSIANWGEAAVAVGAPFDSGTRTSRTALQRVVRPATAIETAIEAIADYMDGACDWRRTEDEIRRLNDTRDRWVEEWLRHRLPGARIASAPYAVTYRWVHEAQGLLATSPAWLGTPTVEQRARYRAFEKRINSQFTRKRLSAGAR